MRFQFVRFFFVGLLCVLAGCIPLDQTNRSYHDAEQEEVSGTSNLLSPETELANESAEQQQSDSFHRDLPRERGDFFSTSGECSACHQGLVDETGSNVSIDEDWRATLMANAARDPYFLATVRNEVQISPSYGDAIQSKCATCHMPMGFQSAGWDGENTSMFTDGLLGWGSKYQILSNDGVSCTVCHQITSQGLGETESFSGGYVIDPDTQIGERVIFGPYEIDEGLALIMQSASGFLPVQSNHMSDSALCGSCHTLYTRSITTDGEITNNLFPEQTPYLEWRHSGYVDSFSCQSCHMPEASGEVLISMMADEPRSPFYQHVFVGGNRYMLQVFKENAADLRVTAEHEQFEQKISQAENMLKNNTATLSAAVGQESDYIEISVGVRNLAGHKFPTGFPSRRAWIHVLVKDIHGETIFESGGWRPDGSIIANDNDDHQEIYEPHYELIDDPGEVQIYESIFVDSDMQVSTGVMQAMTYVKDNRLLPNGFDKESADEDIAVYGLAWEDDDFIEGGNEIVYRVYQGDFSRLGVIVIELLYQSIGYRWLEKFSDDLSIESQVLNVAASRIENSPIVIDSITIEMP